MLALRCSSALGFLKRRSSLSCWRHIGNSWLVARVPQTYDRAEVRFLCDIPWRPGWIGWLLGVLTVAYSYSKLNVSQYKSIVLIRYTTTTIQWCFLEDLVALGIVFLPPGNDLTYSTKSWALPEIVDLHQNWPPSQTIQSDWTSLKVKFLPFRQWDGVRYWVSFFSSMVGCSSGWWRMDRWVRSCLWKKHSKCGMEYQIHYLRING